MKINVELYRDGSKVFNEVKQLISSFPSIDSLDALEDSPEFKQLSSDADRWKALINWLLKQTSENFTPNNLLSQCTRLFENKIEIDQQELQWIAEGKSEETIAEQLYRDCNLEELIKKVFIEGSGSKEIIYLDTLALRELERRADIKAGKASNLDAYIHWNIANARLYLMALRIDEGNNKYKEYANNLGEILQRLQFNAGSLKLEQARQNNILEQSINPGGFLEEARKAIENTYESKNQPPSIAEIYRLTKAAENFNLANVSVDHTKKKQHSKLAIAVYFIISLIGLIAIAGILLASHGLAVPVLAPLGWGLISLVVNAKGLVFILAGLSGLSLFGGIAEIIRPRSTKRCFSAAKRTLPTLCQRVYQTIGPFLKGLGGKIAANFIGLHREINQSLAKRSINPFYKGYSPRNYLRYLKSKPLMAVLLTALYPFAYACALIVKLLLLPAEPLLIFLLSAMLMIASSVIRLGKKLWEGVAWAGKGLGRFSRKASADSSVRLFESSENNAALSGNESVQKITGLLELIEAEKDKKATKERSASRFNHFVTDFSFASRLQICKTKPLKEDFARDNIHQLSAYERKAKELLMNNITVKENARFKKLLDILKIKHEVTLLHSSSAQTNIQTSSATPDAV